MLNATTTTDRPNELSEVWHPYIVMYVLHVVAAMCAMHMSVNCTKALIVIIALSGLLWPVTAILGQPIWGEDGSDPGSDDLNPGSYLWWGTFIKWVIVDALACVPVLVLKAWRNPTRKQIQIVGIFVYVILGSNVVWTMGLIKGDITDFINHVTGAFLTISLIVHCIALCRQEDGKEFFEVKRGLVYGYATPFPWLICYTVWNVMFVAEISVGMTLQDILFWALMLGYRAMDEKREPVEMYFAFARPVQLGTYIGLSEWAGTFIPYLRDANTLKEDQPLPINSNAYFLFLVMVNCVWSVFVTIWAIQRLVRGFDPDIVADRKFLASEVYDIWEGMKEESEESSEDAEG